VFEVVLRDRSGTARAVWFNQRFLKDVLRAGQTVALFGKVEQGAGGLQFASPQYEILADEPLAGRYNAGETQWPALHSPCTQSPLTAHFFRSGIGSTSR